VKLLTRQCAHVRPHSRLDRRGFVVERRPRRRATGPAASRGANDATSRVADIADIADIAGTGAATRAAADCTRCLEAADRNAAPAPSAQPAPYVTDDCVYMRKSAEHGKLRDRWRNLAVGMTAATILVGGATLFLWNRDEPHFSIYAPPSGTGAGAQFSTSW